MTKKAYIAAPTTRIVEMQLQHFIAGSRKAIVDNEETLEYDPTEGNASGGLSRRRRNVWDDEEEEELYW